MVIDHITKFIAESLVKPGRGLEAEAGNLLLIKIHERLLRDGAIDKPWSNIPKNIAYARTVESWVDNNLDAAYAKILKVVNKLDNPLSEVAKYLCEGAESHVWAQIAFSEKCQEVKESYAATYEQLGELYSNDAPIPKEFIDKIGADSVKETDTRKATLDRITKTLEIEIHTKIGTQVSKLTDEAISPAPHVADPVVAASHSSKRHHQSSSEERSNG